MALFHGPGVVPRRMDIVIIEAAGISSLRSRYIAIRSLYT